MKWHKLNAPCIKSSQLPTWNSRFFTGPCHKIDSVEVYSCLSLSNYTFTVLCIYECCQSSRYRQITIFVWPELSSGRDLVIQMSVRRAPSAVRVFGQEHFSGTVCPTLMIICYVSGARAEVARAEFWAWHRLIKYLICKIYTKLCPEHFSWNVFSTLMIFGMWVGLEPKVRMVNFGRGTCWSPRTPGVKNVKQCSRTTKLGQKNHWYKLKMMMTFMKVKGHQRSKGVDYVLWLPYFVKITTDASWEFWWPLWRSKVIKGQIW